MPDNRVDTTRPEYSWIPFFEELAHRLHEDGWRNRQGDIVAELQRMRREGVSINSEVDKLIDRIDPFSIFAMIRSVGFQKATKIMEGYKSFFGVRAELPTVEPVNPKVVPVNSMFFPREPDASHIDPHWDLFDLVMRINSDELRRNTQHLESLLNASEAVHGAGVASVTGALYWVNPHRFLKTDTIDHYLGVGDYSDFGRSYLIRLNLLQVHDGRPFPELNYEEWLNRDGLADVQIDQTGEDEDGLHPRTWLVWSGAGGSFSDLVVENGFIAIGWDSMKIRGCKNRDELNLAYSEAYPDASNQSRGNEVGSISRFVFEMTVGDYVLTPNGMGGFYVGVVAGETTYDADDGFGFPTRRLVTWESRGPHPRTELPPTFWHGINPTVLELKGRKRAALLAFLKDNEISFAHNSYSIDSMLQEGVFLEREEIERTLSLLQRKQNLILQGPPGTGKTFIARRLAYALIGAKDESRIASVQFHQSYSYEDFVGGLRPDVNEDDQLVFKASDGAFLRLCEKARKDEPNRPYVMLIDEINRGNLSRVFGELMMLIEPDKREEDQAVDLPHRAAMVKAGDAESAKFHVPKNVYIIGTMNLADRSLTGMNVAMRRRFGFVDLRPQFGELRFDDWLAENGLPRDDEELSRLRNKIIERMTELNRSIQDDRSLGAQYAVGHSFFCPAEDDPVGGDWDAWYMAVIEHEIKPLLKEYWFDQPEKAEDAVVRLLND